VQATAMTQATTAEPRAAEMPETVLKPTTRQFLQKFAKNCEKIQRNREKIALFCLIGFS
jgi:hypothetical protein